MKMDKKTIVLAALVALAGVTVYLANKADDKTGVTYPTIPEIMGEEIVVTEAPGEPTVDEDGVVELPEITISVPVPKDNGPVLHGTKICRWYERAGITAAHEAGEWLESTCEVNTCFLMVHEANVPAIYIMAGWLSEANTNGRDPAKDGVDLSVFTFDKDGNPLDHAVYIAGHDEFDTYQWK